MTLKLSKLEKLHQEATKGPYKWAKDGALRAKDGTIMMDAPEDGDESAIKDGNFIKASYEKIPALISWVRRARAYLKKELPNAKSSLERFESTLGRNKVVQEKVIPRLKNGIAELEQLLAEVEE